MPAKRKPKTEPVEQAQNESGAVVPFQFKSKMEEPWFDRGDYLLVIRKVALNKLGDPFITFVVVRSHDGRRVNQYYSINFHLSSSSEASAKLWEEKLSRLCDAVNLRDVTELNQFLGEHVTMRVSKSGRAPLPNFLPANMFSMVAHLKPAAHTQDLPPLELLAESDMGFNESDNGLPWDEPA